jgi:hypothetical protein
MSLPTFPDHYRALGIKQDASEAEIKKAYKKTVLKYHPDKNPADQARYLPLFHAAQKAYEVLSDSARKAKYDAELLRNALPKTSKPTATYNAPQSSFNTQSKISSTRSEDFNTYSEGFHFAWNENLGSTAKRSYTQPEFTTARPTMPTMPTMPAMPAMPTMPAMPAMPAPPAPPILLYNRNPILQPIPSMPTFAFAGTASIPLMPPIPNLMFAGNPTMQGPLRYGGGQSIYHSGDDSFASFQYDGGEDPFANLQYAGKEDPFAGL